MKYTVSFYRLPGLNNALKRCQFFWRAAFFMVVAGLVTIITTLLQPAAHAYDVVIQPASPQQGDTISILVTETRGTGSLPTVAANGTTYPTFAIGNNRYRTFVPTSPLHGSGRYVIQVTGSETPRNPAFWLSDRTFATQYITLSPNQQDLGTDYEFDQVDAFKQLVSADKYWNGPFLRPSDGRVSSEYGFRRYYNGVFAENYYHRGVDYAAPIGAPVIAPAPGKVVLTGQVSEGFELHGNTIGIDHGQGVASIFIHLNSISVQEGDFVEAGQTIGTVGTTGASTGPHLHWGLYVNGVAVDPAPWRTTTIE